MLIRKYLQITKPGIIFGNIITTVAGFFLASQGTIDPALLFSTVFGLSFVIASACVYNNYIDRDVDSKMNRTKIRATVTGEISGRAALIFATILGIIGFWLLYFTNLFTMALAFVGLFFYVVVYGIAKRRSIYGTEIGSIAGAMPIVAGYTAVANRIDTGAFLLFFVLAFWQMPHFFSIAIYRSKDYAEVGIPVLPLKKGVEVTKIRILFYIVAFMIAAAALTIFKYTGYTFLLTILLLGVFWVWYGIKNFKSGNDSRWARKMFFFSLVVLLSLSILLAIDSFLP